MLLNINSKLTEEYLLFYAEPQLQQSSSDTPTLPPTKTTVPPSTSSTVDIALLLTNINLYVVMDNVIQYCFSLSSFRVMADKEGGLQGGGEPWESLVIVSNSISC